jgi:hypothetical protein
MDARTAHSTSTGDSPELRDSRLAADRDHWRDEAREREAAWTEEWVIITTFRRTGDKAFWSDTGRSPYLGNARRYATEELAGDTAESLRQRGVIDDYHLEARQLPQGGLRSRVSSHIMPYIALTAALQFSPGDQPRPPSTPRSSRRSGQDHELTR